MEAKTLIPDFWSQPDSGKILQSIKDKKATVEEYGGLCTKLEDTLLLCDMGIEENDESVVDEVLKDVKEISDTADRMRLETLLTGEYDRNNAILSFHPRRAERRHRTGADALPYVHKMGREPRLQREAARLA